MLAAGACRGCINSVVMFVLVNKHGMTPSSLAAFSAGVILAAIFANAVVFPRSYDALGPRAMLSVFCVVTAVSFGTAYASEDYPVL
jgi:putative flippase GtrA